MPRIYRLTLLVLLPLAAMPLAGGEPLTPASEFATIADDTERAEALFLEAAKVLRHPRCVNCHPSGDRPLQGELGELHQPPARRGPGGIGVVGMRCATCHHDANYDPAGVPGEKHWVLAPRKMAWEGLSAGQICEQLKDPARNGNKNLDEIARHMAEDPLVGWGWQPGAGREPAPGTQDSFAALIQAWIDSGAACPD